jgi:hypothetical protein
LPALPYENGIVRDLDSCCIGESKRAVNLQCAARELRLQIDERSSAHENTTASTNQALHFAPFVFGIDCQPAKLRFTECEGLDRVVHGSVRQHRHPEHVRAQNLDLVWDLQFSFLKSF